MSIKSENRYGELDKIIQGYVDHLINSLASSGSCITEEKKIELLKSFREQVSEETRKGMVDDSDSDSDVESDELEPEDCYAFYNCDEIDLYVGYHDALQHFKRHTVGDTEYRTTYYQTYGGGPEGGYFVKVAVHLPTGKETREVYSVDRNWGTPFTATLIHNKKLIYETGIEPSPRRAGKMAQVRLMDM